MKIIGLGLAVLTVAAVGVPTLANDFEVSGIGGCWHPAR